MSATLPAELHRLRGTRPTRAKAKPENTPFVGGKPRMPKNLDALAQEKWKELASILRKRETLTKGDGPILELAAITYGRYRAELEDLKTTGTMIDVTYFANEREYTKRVLNPLSKVVAQLERDLRQLYIQLGVTPTTRQKAKQVSEQPTKKSQLEVDPECSYGVYLRCKAQGSDAPPPAGFVAGMHLPVGFVETEVAPPTRKVPAAVAAAQEKAGAFDDIDLDALNKELLGK